MKFLFLLTTLAASVVIQAEAKPQPFPRDYGSQGGRTASDFVIDHFSGNRQRPPSTVDYGCNWNFRLKKCMPAGYPTR